jgi:hypothetical protein
MVCVSTFLLIIGSPYSSAVATEQCSAGGCVGSEQFSSEYVPTQQAVIPLFAALILCLGLVMKKEIVTWAGGVSLLAFSVVGIFSIGLFFLPLSIILLALLPFAQKVPRQTELQI